MATISLSCPEKWSDMTQAQLVDFYTLMAAHTSPDEIPALLFMKWNGLRSAGHTSAGAAIMIASDDTVFEVGTPLMAEIVSALDFLKKPPVDPAAVRPDEIQGVGAVSPLMDGVAFEVWLAADNFYQGHIHTGDPQLLDEIARLFYPGLNGDIPAWGRVAVFYWMVALKSYMANRFPDLFHADSGERSLGGGGADPARLRDSVDAQIRALTRGDVCKEKEVLAIDTTRALTELNAQAREAAEINRKYGKAN